MTGETSGSPADRCTRLVTRALAPNPGPMTLDGTNSYVLRAPGSESVAVVDPGPEDLVHLRRLAHSGPVDLVLVTHHHQDHAESIATFAAMTGAPVRAAESTLCIGAPPLTDGEQVTAGGCRLVVIATPGHTADSLSFALPDDAPLDRPGRAGSVLTGDTILGRGTTIIADDGSLSDYLSSLQRLREVGPAVVLPGHGPSLADLTAVCDEYTAHRRSRLDGIVAALRQLGLQPAQDPDTVSRVVDVVYSDIDPSIRFAAEASTRAQLRYLETAG